MSPTLDYVVKNNTESTFQLKAIYDSPVSESVVQTNNYTNSYTYSLEVSNELGKQDIVHAIEDYPDTVDNPSTKAVIKYVLLIACILFVISIGLFLIIRKNKIGKLFIFIGIIGILTPIIVYAYKTFNLKIKANVTITKPVQLLCKKATTLHTEECTATDSNKYCSGAGYVSGNKGTTITYGTIPNGTPKSGDAYDCDVNNDGVYDSNTERFYYLTNIDDNKVSLIYYNNVNNGQKYQYDDVQEAWHGPRVAYQDLPSLTEWSNPLIIAPGTRQIQSESYNSPYLPSWDNGNQHLLESFTYTNKAARLLTIKETHNACGVGNLYSSPDVPYGTLDNCLYLFENLPNFLNGQTSSDYDGYWLETPDYGSSDFADWVFAEKRVLSRSMVLNTYKVRPVIEVNKSYIEQ